MNKTIKRYLVDDAVNFCYIDESGVGQEPIATMVGILVDARRMHRTKKDWNDLLDILSEIAGRRVVELKTADFYPGNGVWRDLSGDQRARIENAVCEWIVGRKHQIVYSSVLKELFRNDTTHIPVEVNTPWRFMAFHITLAIQRLSQKDPIPKGNTLLTFDNKKDEERKFIELVKNPPLWSEEYYNKEADKSPLDQIIDIPHFADSKDIGLLQVADFVAFFLRRYAEITEGVGREPYPNEEQLLNEWIKKLCECRIRSSHIYYQKGRNKAQELFYQYAPISVRDL